MSRIGKKVIELPAKVKLSISGEGAVSAEGPKGKLAWTLPKNIKGRVEGNTVHIERTSEDRKVRALHGLSRALVNNIVTGVATGFVKDLEIQGVGFKANLKGKQLDLALGYSHPIVMDIPEGIKITVVDQTKVKVEGADKQLVGAVTAEIRSYYPPEPYKGKGVRYLGEYVQRKAGKAAK